ncbi:hypothetical protein F5Y12DRAFT_588111 [Xylaria sp. FL1777]|nr:hypothetical protein F5Y12DRAFT_588111 [Xylaria sp. FL1777]
MELLRQTALSMYDEYDNFDASSAAELKIARVEAEVGKSDTATYDIEDASEANILSRVSSICGLASKPKTRPERGESTTASLLLVSMWTSSNGNASEGVGISKAGFLGLIDALDIDRSVLQPFTNNIFGFLEFSEAISNSSGKSISTYFLADARIELIWSFNFLTSETKAILITRHDPPDPLAQNQSHHILADFLASLRQQRGNIFNPYTLLFISLVQMTAWESKPHARKRDGVRAFEPNIGYGGSGWPAPEQTNDAISSGMTLENPAMATTHIETSAASLARDERQMDVIDSLLDALSDPSPWRQRLAVTPVAKRQLELCERDIGVFSAVLRPLRQQNAAARSALRYTAARVRGQSDVILALRAQEEARINREIAEASRDLAEAAKRDAASMKTIAVMTMAFLPGTFFAALFSVPLLRWDQEVVVSERFWVYLVFTLPVTAFVFLIWLVLSYDDGFRTAIEEYQRKKNVSMSRTGLLHDA